MLAILTILAIPIGTLAGNSFIQGELSVDNPSVTNGQFLNYRHYIYTANSPVVQDPETVSAWFGIDLAQFDGSTYSAEFTQVGVLANRGWARWFVYAEPGVECFRGTPRWQDPNNPNLWRGCVGNYGDLGVTPMNNAWTRVEAVTYSGQSWWTLRVYDVNGVSYDVAKVNSASKQIYRARATSEEAYSGSTDPYIFMNFYHYHPEYHTGYNFSLWPGGTGGLPENWNRIWVAPNSICPTGYGAETGIQGTPHLWRTAGGDTTCFESPLF